MAKEKVDSAFAAQKIMDAVRSGIFAPVYLLMGEEPYYVDLVSAEIQKYALTEDERDFNQFILYGPDTDVDDVVGCARRYPMFAERSLVIVREAQNLSKLEDLSVYVDSPLESTVLVIVYRGSLDKRKALYKSIAKNGQILESVPVRDYEMAGWIGSYFSSRGLRIASDAAALLAEYAGTDLNKITVETDKLLKNLPEGTTDVSAADIEANVGISREFSLFELTRQLSFRDAVKALRTAAYIGADAHFAMPKATAALFFHFNKLLRYQALMLKYPNPPAEEKTKILGAPFFWKEYDVAARNYPLQKTMAVISLIRDYDFKGKGGECGEATPQDLLTELITKILQ